MVMEMLELLDPYLTLKWLACLVEQEVLIAIYVLPTLSKFITLELVEARFPITRTIHNARILFEELDEEEFLAPKPELKFNITIKLTSDKDIVSDSPLHACLRCIA
ncbi:hypothetical protein LOD99_15174 [Oopsacas minuta]|uniref:Uncharacterized protein n=1 Tax=Oopsacas minuta TaxID=111878 RepID=A0AAV7KFK1_9METZ|nr:hypothetical protein LOD99_15174 [Oopsacas minuta]